ncbi:Imm1 family immunity protein [Kitasatospora sp. NPDC051170]|uniref:Imm1 family immunity protein n=1 Tax=Kitasatospora sp. NPDC051170 TaxID=3364056 RepID=UPI00378D8D68
MLLKVWSKGREQLPVGERDVEAVMAEALRAAVGGQAVFSFFEPGVERRMAYLRATVGEAGDYGALLWMNTLHVGGVYDWCWLSDNPRPSGAEPALVSDNCTGAYYDPSSVLPLASITAAVREYCLGGTGERPASVDWVTGEFNGYRNDNGRGGIPGDPPPR